MTPLRRILDRMPPEHREAFQRLVLEAGLKDDSPDLLDKALVVDAIWTGVEALQKEALRFEQLAMSVPGAVRDEIREALESDLVGQIRDSVARHVISMHGEAVSRISQEAGAIVLASGQRMEDRIDAGVKKVEVSHDKTYRELLHAADRHRDHLKAWRDLQGHTFLIAIGICVVLIIASAGISWKIAWDRAYHAGAYVERAAILHRAER